MRRVEIRVAGAFLRHHAAAGNGNLGNEGGAYVVPSPAFAERFFDALHRYAPGTLRRFDGRPRRGGLALRVFVVALPSEQVGCPAFPRLIDHARKKLHRVAATRHECVLVVFHLAMIKADTSRLEIDMRDLQ